MGVHWVLFFPEFCNVVLHIGCYFFIVHCFSFDVFFQFRCFSIGCCFVLFVLFDLILFVPSTIFQLNRDGSSWVEPVLS